MSLSALPVEVAQCVAALLSEGDTARLLRVSRALLSLFAPLLYRNPKVSRSSLFASSLAPHNAKLIHSLILHPRYPPSLLALCTSLASLDCSAIATLPQLPASLTHLTIPASLLTSSLSHRSLISLTLCGPLPDPLPLPDPSLLPCLKRISLAPQWPISASPSALLPALLLRSRLTKLRPHLTCSLTTPHRILISTNPSHKQLKALALLLALPANPSPDIEFRKSALRALPAALQFFPKTFSGSLILTGASNSDLASLTTISIPLSNIHLDWKVQDIDPLPTNLPLFIKSQHSLASLEIRARLVDNLPSILAAIPPSLTRLHLQLAVAEEPIHDDSRLYLYHQRETGVKYKHALLTLAAASKTLKNLSCLSLRAATYAFDLEHYNTLLTVLTNLPHLTSLKLSSWDIYIDIPPGNDHTFGGISRSVYEKTINIRAKQHLSRLIRTDLPHLSFAYCQKRTLGSYSSR